MEVAMALVIGVDAGGTATRAVVVETADEVVLGSADGPAGNALSVPPDQLAARLTACLAECLRQAGIQPADIEAVVAGLAGFRAAPKAAEQVRAAAAEAGLTCTVRVYYVEAVDVDGCGDEPDGV